MKLSARQWIPIVTATVALVAVVGVLVGIDGQEQPSMEPTPPSLDLGDVLTGFAATLRPEAPYRPPTASERRDVVAALSPLFGESSRIDRSHEADALRPLGFTPTMGTDPATGREYALVVNERGTERAWGFYLVDLSRPVRLAVEVPHPNFDLGTERIGLALFRAVPGAALLVAGTHRRAERGAGDVAHRTDSAFHAVATDLAERDVPQVQLHGFHDDSLPDTDVVISPGAGKAGEMIRRIAAGIDDRGLKTCRSWERDCGRLEGTSNEQGKVAAEQESVFVHLEMNRSVRDDERQWGDLVRAVARGLEK
ncbi:hypothetical protein JOF56_003777 [Kibdelosporangium banguiense]|uniref:Uncharacterized protein n=1 Tax=Kibdelosporangium banguiense TaxID=1365924 RepID=A0ABS4TG44_9PSEU|nr:hypothetical protein [Kibdelosporangium banguiense]MBP2323392.1 hypothetical protein [Kibdelosporangium banguiense]